MKVLSIIHYAYFGGPHNRNTLLRPVLEEMGFDMIVLLPDEKGNAYDIMKNKGINVIKMPLHRLRSTISIRIHLTFFLSLFKEIIQLRKFIINNDIDVVLINGLANPHGAIAAKLSGIPVVWQILDTRTPKIVSFFMMLLARAFSSVIMSTGVNVAKIHPFTSGLNNRLVNFFPPVDTQKFVIDEVIRTNIRKDLGIPKDSLLVATVGNFNPQKGHEFFIEAAKIVEKECELKNMSVYFLIFGSTMPTHKTYFNKLNLLIKDLDFNSIDKFRLLRPKYEIHQVLSAFDIFVQASVPNSEGIPTAILEAISCGLPIVSSDVGSISEVVIDGQNGTLVPSMKVTSMASAILTLLNDPEKRKKMSLYSINQVKHKIGLESCAIAHMKSFNLSMD